MASNLFSSLAKYASLQEENFLSESLVLLLRIILEREKEHGLDLLSNLCGVKKKEWFCKPLDIELSTQFSIQEGRPDIVIRDGNKSIVFIEVKHDSGLGDVQLERYSDHLTNSPILNKRLVLLTRSKSSIQETSLSANQFHHICWYQIAGWLSDFDFQDVIVLYFLRNFIEFLKEKDMSMEKVTWEYIKGLPAMINLSNMLGTAISEVFPEKSLRKTVGANWSGYYLDGNYFIGFRFNDPLVIVIEDNNGTNPSYKKDFIFEEEVQFFSLSAGDQLESIISFIKNSIEK